MWRNRKFDVTTGTPQALLPPRAESAKEYALDRASLASPFIDVLTNSNLKADSDSDRNKATLD